MKPSQFMFANFLEEPPEERFRVWPLHITLVPWVRADYESIQDVAKTVASRNQRFLIRNNGSDYFGPKRDRYVRTLERTPEIITLHNSLLSHLEERHISYGGLRYVAENYRPHVTVNPKNSILVASEIMIDAISIVEKDEDENYRMTRDTYYLIAEQQKAA